MPKRNTTPLTDEQADFAAKNKGVLEKYLRDRELPIGEFYDIAVFGYLRAVRRYLTEPELHRYKFKTVAKSAMRTEIGNHFRALRAQKRDRVVVPFEEYIHSGDMEDQVYKTVEHQETHRAVSQVLGACLTRSQAKIVQMKAQRYNNREIAEACGLHCSAEVERELERVRAQVIQFAPALADLAA